MSRLRIVVLLSFLCAPPLRAQGPNLRVGLAAAQQPILLDSLARPHALAGDRAQILAAIIGVYDALAIPIDYRNTESGIVVAERFVVRRQLGKAPLSRYIDCGQGMNGVNANVYRITMVVAAWLYPSQGPVSEVRLAVVGSGQDMAGSNVQSVICDSKGVLEDEIATQARKRLASAGQ